MKKYILSVMTFVFCLFMSSCSKEGNVETIPIPEPEAPAPDPDTDPIIVNTIPSSPQREGDAQIGYAYLTSGDYISSGIPYDAYILGFGENTVNRLNRTGDNAVIPYDYTAVTAPNGVRVVGPNCLACHASFVNDEFIIGLGAQDADYTSNRANAIPLLNAAIAGLYGGTTSDEYQAYDPFRKSIVALGPKTVTESRGVNPADKIAQVLIAHRDKTTLEWLEVPNVVIGNEVVPTDVPAWWLLKNKNAMFYAAIGRKDFCKSFIGSSLLTLADASKAEEVDAKMVDVLTYIKTLQPPEYPFPIDNARSETGKLVFEAHCVKCHGTYDASPSYPNLLVALETIGTDPELSKYYTTPSPTNDYFLEWFNTGWFGTYTNPLEIIADGGYIAPPLDGIWATAPYFHNASVPTLAEVLDSTERPIYWSRTFDSTHYDPIKVGWQYTLEAGKSNTNTYDTTLKGYGNMGHTFGDVLTDTERNALLEYLKTL